MEPEPEPEPKPAPAPLEAAGASWRPFDEDAVEEVLLKIFARLAPKSLVRAGLVCREWHAQSCDDELWAALHNNVLVDRSKMHRLRKDTLFAASAAPSASGSSRPSRREKAKVRVREPKNRRLRDLLAARRRDRARDRRRPQRRRSIARTPRYFVSAGAICHAGPRAPPARRLSFRVLAYSRRRPGAS